MSKLYPNNFASTVCTRCGEPMSMSIKKAQLQGPQVMLT